MHFTPIRKLVMNDYGRPARPADLSRLSRAASNAFSYVGVKIGEPAINDAIAKSGGSFDQIAFLGMLDIFNREYAGRVIDLGDGTLPSLLPLASGVAAKFRDKGFNEQDLLGAIGEPYVQSFGPYDSFGNTCRRAIESLHSEPDRSRVKTYEPNIIVCDSAWQVAVKGGEIVMETVEGNRNARLGFATGNTMVPVNGYLRQIGKGRFGSVFASYLDEYIWTDKNDTPQRSYRKYMTEGLYDALSVRNAAFFDPAAADLAVEAGKYESLLRGAPVDVQLLGIGDENDVHIAFNQRYSSFTSRTRVVGISSAVRIKNAPDFHDDPESVCDFAFTVGLETLIKYPKRVVLLAIGAAKKESIRRMLERPTEAVPASALLLRDGVTVIVDRAASPF